MGLDFIQKAKKTLQTKWDAERVRLGTSDLLTQSPKSAGCSAVFELAANASLHEGEHVQVDAEDGMLIASQRQRVVAVAEEPPPHVLKAVEDSCGMADGKIEHVHSIAGVAEISLC